MLGHGDTLVCRHGHQAQCTGNVFVLRTAVPSDSLSLMCSRRLRFPLAQRDQILQPDKPPVEHMLHTIIGLLNEPICFLAAPSPSSNQLINTWLFYTEPLDKNTSPQSYTVMLFAKVDARWRLLYYCWSTICFHCSLLKVTVSFSSQQSTHVIVYSCHCPCIYVYSPVCQVEGVPSPEHSNRYWLPG